MNKKILTLMLAVVVSVFSLQTVFAGVAIIVNPNSGLESANQTEVVNLFLSKSKSLQGKPLKTLDLPKGEAARDNFYNNVVNKNESQLKAYWSRLIFTGKGLPPAELANEKMVLDRVASDPNAIGYISSDKVTSAVKVLATF